MEEIMEFGWINFLGAGIVLVMLLPNLVYALNNRGAKNRCRNKLMNVIEQVGRYGCFLLMWLPLLVWEFGFQKLELLVIYLFGNGLLLCAYLIVWVFYFKGKSTCKSMLLAILPTCIFLLSGLTLHHWLLVFSAALFGVGHLYVTWQNR